MNRTKSILAAGSLTGLVLITILGLGFRGINAASKDEQDSAAEPTPIVIRQPETDPAVDEAVQSWQIYSQDLETTVQIMQQREAEYQAQLEAANQTIFQLEDQLNTANAFAGVQLIAPDNQSAPAYYDDDDGSEYEENDDDDRYENEEYDDDD